MANKKNYKYKLTIFFAFRFKHTSLTTKMAITSLDPGPGAAALQAWGGQMAAFGSNETVVDKVLPDMLHLIDPHW